MKWGQARPNEINKLSESISFVQGVWQLSRVGYIECKEIFLINHNSNSHANTVHLSRAHAKADL